jgi:hypothetical protein
MNCFLNNKYTKIYYQIINKAKSRAKPEGYTEKHHIIPKCMGGKEVIPLTFREHFICHHLLIKMCKTSKQKWSMYHAFDLMGKPNKNQSDRIINSKMFERIKTANRQLSFGRKCSEETKMKMSESQKGKKHSIESKRKMSKSQLGNKNNLGHKHSKKTKLKMSLSSKGKLKSKKHIKNMVKAKSFNWQIIYPNGKIKVIKNLSDFCRKNNLNQGAMCQLAKGKLKYYKGFKCKQLEEII